MAKGAVRVGRRFGRLEVLGEDEPYFWRGRFSRRRWLCACDCGGEAVVREDRLTAGTTLSCGCLRVEAAEERLLRHGGRAAGRATPGNGSRQRCDFCFAGRSYEWCFGTTTTVRPSGGGAGQWSSRTCSSSSGREL